MIELLAVLADQIGPVVSTALLVLVRVSTAMALLPAFGERSVPMRVRVAATVALVTVTTPYVAGAPAPTTTALAPLIASEALTGALLGFTFRVAIWALQTAGTVIAQSVSLSQIFGQDLSADAGSAMSALLVAAGLALLMAADFHLHVVTAILRSYSMFPVGQPLAARDLFAEVVPKIAASLSFAFTLSGPFIAAALLYNLTLGAINRAMPQLMVAFVGAPFLTLGGLALFAVSSPALLSVWMQAVLGGAATTGIGVP